MKFVRLAICVIVLGAITTYVVAWACATIIDVSSQPTRLPYLLSSDADCTWRLIVWSRCGASRVESYPAGPAAKYILDIDPSLAPTWSRTSGVATLQASPLLEDARGWPCVALMASFVESLHDYKSGYVTSLELGGLVLSEKKRDGRTQFVLPVIPIWPGFAINTIFYATILWLMWFMPAAIRRSIRRRRGQCPACTYPIGSSPVCTECGKAIEPI